MLYTLKTLLLNGCMSRHIVHMYVVVEACIYFDLKTVCIIFSPVVVFPARGPSKLNNRPPNHHAILRQATGTLRRTIAPYSGKQLALFDEPSRNTPARNRHSQTNPHAILRQATARQQNNAITNLQHISTRELIPANNRSPSEQFNTKQVHCPFL